MGEDDQEDVASKDKLAAERRRLLMGPYTKVGSSIHLNAPSPDAVEH